MAATPNLNARERVAARRYNVRQSGALRPVTSTTQSKR